MFFHFGSQKQARCQKPPLALVVMDGFGLAPASEGNAITLANPSTYNRLWSEYPHAEMIASGESIGLPANEVGNTEVGHLTLGAGRVIYQDLVRINRAIKDGTILTNQAFLKAAEHVGKNNSNLHIMGLIGLGGVHANNEHLYALLDFCAKNQIKNVFLHLITDGRDSPPNACLEVVQEVQQTMSRMGVGRIASISGRYYAMDRDRRWDRTEKAYLALVSGMGKQAASAETAIQQAYIANITDEFIEPTLISDTNGPIGIIKDNDALIFYNFRIDRPRQLTMALVMPNFENLPAPEQTGVRENTFHRQKKLNNLFMVTMTEYQKGLPVSAIAFGPQVISDNMAFAVSQAGMSQLAMSESEKERFVTYYFRGMQEVAYPLMETIIIESPKVATYDMKPEMSLWGLVSEFKKRMLTCGYQFTVMNWANPDMVAHTGNLKATIRAIGEVDKALAEMEKVMLAAGGTLVITADHGNAEELLTYPQTGFFYSLADGKVNTEHSSNKVPLIIVNEAYKGKPVELEQGILSDVAPTIMPFIGLKPTPGMSGRNLLESV